MPKYLNNKKGSNLILVIVFLMLFMIVVGGVSMVVSFGVNSGVVQRNYTQAYYAAKTINLSIAEAITSEKGLSIINSWDDDFNIDSYVIEVFDNTGMVIGVKINRSKGSVLKSYTNGTHGVNDNLSNDIKVNNKITLKYIVVDDITYKALIEVKTTATHDGQSYTQTAELENSFNITDTGSGTPGEVVYDFKTDKYQEVNRDNIEHAIFSTSNSIKFTWGQSALNVNEDIVAGMDVMITSNKPVVNGNIIALNKVDITGEGLTVRDNLIALKGIKIHSVNSVEVNKSVITKGNFEASGGITNITGDIITLGEINIGNAGTIGSAGKKNVIISHGDVNLDSYERIVHGDIYSNSNIDITGGTINGDIVANGNVTVENATVNGNIKANGNVTMLNGGSAKSIYSNGNITLSHVNVAGDVKAQGNTDLSYCSVNNIFSNKNVILIQNNINGSIYSKGSISSTNNYNTTIKGSIYSNSKVTLNGGTINLNIEYHGDQQPQLTNVNVKGSVIKKDTPIKFDNEPINIDKKNVNKIINDRINNLNIIKIIEGSSTLPKGWSTIYK